MVILCASSCENLTKSEIGSSLSIQILLKITSIVHVSGKDSAFVEVLSQYKNGILRSAEGLRHHP